MNLKSTATWNMNTWYIISGAHAQQRTWLLFGPSLFASCRERYCLISFLRELTERENDLFLGTQNTVCVRVFTNHMSLFYFLIFLECQFNLEAQTSTFTHNCLLLPRYDSQRQNDNSGRALKRDRQPKVAVLRLARIWKLLGGFLMWRPLFVWIISPPTFLRKFFLFIRKFLYFWSLSSPFMCKRS